MAKRFNLKGVDGLYLSNHQSNVTSVNYKELLIENYDFYPTDESPDKDFVLKNAGYELNALIGSNSSVKANSSLLYSEITKKRSMVINEIYHMKFEFYFRFYDGFVGSVTNVASNRLRFKIFAEFGGGNRVQLKLENLRGWQANTQTYTTTPLTALNGKAVLGNTGADYYVDLNYNQTSPNSTNPTTFFQAFNSAPNRHNMVLTASLNQSSIITKAKGNSDFKLIVKYYVPTTLLGTTFVEMMSAPIITYQSISDYNPNTPPLVIVQ